MKKSFFTFFIVLILFYSDISAVEFEFKWTFSDMSSYVGLETDGTYFYSCKFNGSAFRRFDKNGNSIDTFVISGVTNIRDLAYDGQYFYGGSAGNVIYKLDLQNRRLIGTISSPTQTVRSIAYVPTADNGRGAFWVGNWDTYSFSLVNRDGLEIDKMTFTSSDTLVPGIYGTAYDDESPGGPYLWCIHATQDFDLRISRIDLKTKKVSKALIPIEKAGYLGGGLCYTTTLFPGKRILAGVIQNVGIFGIDLNKINFPDLDAELSSVNLEKYIKAGQITISGVITNLGTSKAINSMDICWQVDNGDIRSTTVTGLNIPPNETYSFSHPEKWNAEKGNHIVKIFITNVNNWADTYYANDTLTLEIQVFEQTASKKVLFEEFSTTKCGYCPDGHLVLQNIISKYPDKIVPIIHHAGFYTDSMTIPESETYASYYAAGAPTAAIDRKLSARSRTTWEQDVLTCAKDFAPGSVKVDYTYNPTTRLAEVTITVRFIEQPTPGDFRITLFVVEDSVVGYGSGYDQANYYNTDSGHPMYGKGNPIVGYVHRHVIRKVIPAVWGEAGIIPQNPELNKDYSVKYSFNLKETWKDKDISFAAFVSYFNSDVNQRFVLNAEEKEIDAILSVNINDDDREIRISPIPANDYLQIENAENYSLNITNLLGQSLINKKIENYTEKINISNFPAGAYLIVLSNNKKTLSRTIIIE